MRVDQVELIVGHRANHLAIEALALILAPAHALVGRLHLLNRALALGDVAHHREQALLASDGGTLQIHLHPEAPARSILRQPLEQLGLALRRPMHPLQGPRECIGLLVGAQVADRQRPRFLGRVAIHLAHLAVDVQDPPGGGIVNQDGVIHGVEDGAVVDLRGAQPLLGLPTLGDIAGDGDHLAIEDGHQSGLKDSGPGFVRQGILHCRESVLARGALDSLQDVARGRRREDILHPSALELGRRQVQTGFVSRTVIENRPIGLQPEVEIRQRLEDGAQLRGSQLQPLFGLDPLGDIVREDDARGPSLIDDRVCEEIDVEGRAVLAPVPPDARHHLAGLVLALTLQERGRILRRPDLLHRHREELVARVAGLAEHRVVRGQERERFLVVDVHRIGILFEEGAVLVLPLAKRALHLALRRDLRQDRHHRTSVKAQRVALDQEIAALTPQLGVHFAWRQVAASGCGLPERWQQIGEHAALHFLGEGHAHDLGGVSRSRE